MATRRKNFTLEEKRNLLKLYDQLPRMSQKMAAKRLNVAQSVLCTLLRDRNYITRGDPHARIGKVSRLEAALWRWIDACQSKNAPPSDLLIHKKAMELAGRMGVSQFRASPRWYIGFKRRERAVRERYHVFPDTEGSKTSTEALPLAEALQDQEARMKRGDSVVEPLGVRLEQSEPPSQKPEPTVITATINGGMQTITVPSLHQMKEAMKTLATGLLYRGFCDFKLLHQFEKEVASVVKRSMSQGSQDSFLA